MISELFSIGPLSISPFGPMLVLAFFAAFWQLRRNLLTYGIGDDEDASAILFAAGLCGILGGKIYYAALNGDPALLLDRAGIVWYGGFFGGLVAALWVIRRRRLPVMATVDCALPALALGYGVGRIGCFLVGDDYGKPTDLPWGMVFKEGIPRTNGFQLRSVFGLDLPPEIGADDWVAVHPTQLYETLIAVGIWLLLIKLLARRPAVGMVTFCGIALLALERFGVEFLRAKDDRFFGSLTLAQVISLTLIAVVLWPIWRRYRGVVE